jgi:hypothetical protein
MNYQLIVSKHVEKTRAELEQEKKRNGYGYEPNLVRDETVLTVEITEEQWNRVRNAVLKEI